MINCQLIFILDDGTELIGKEDVHKHIHLFPAGIEERIRPIYFDTMNKTENWNKSIFRVYQDGTYKIDLNLPPDTPLNPF
jgi:hypothetical protein